jgi:hypothetical protein
MSVFAHVHPVGSISMAPLELTHGENGMGACQWPCNLDPCRPRSVSHRVFQNLGSIGFSCSCGRAPMGRQPRSTPMWSDAANFVVLSLRDNEACRVHNSSSATIRSSRPWPSISRFRLSSNYFSKPYTSTSPRAPK